MASQLLQLPRELREEIYLLALLHSPNPTSLLQTCPQITMEAQPLLYQRPVKLSSQAKLFDWIDRSRAQNLRQVRHLSLHLTDIDLSPLLASDRSRSRDQNQNQNENSPKPPSAWSLYEDELARFDTALRSLPSLTEITIVPPRVMHSQLLRGMYLSLLALIPRLHPGLKLLVVHDDETILDVVKPLQGIPKVVFKNSQVAGGGKGANGEVVEIKKSPSSSPPTSKSKSPRGKATRIKTEEGEGF